MSDDRSEKSGDKAHSAPGADKVDGHKVDLSYGGRGNAAKAGAAAQLTHPVTAPAEGDLGLKNAERLRILMRAPSYQTAEKTFFDKLEAKFRIGVSQAARKVGFGQWKKKFAGATELTQALQTYFLPALSRDLGIALPPLQAAGEDLWLGAWPELAGEPPLHPDYVADAAPFGFTVFQEEVKHVAHSYAMAVTHGFLRTAVAAKRAQPEAAALHGLSAEQLYVFEANLCQYYVPHTLAAYFENQPMRLFARELANRFRKVAFGGQ